MNDDKLANCTRMPSISAGDCKLQSTPLSQSSTSTTTIVAVIPTQVSDLQSATMVSHSNAVIAPPSGNVSVSTASLNSVPDTAAIDTTPVPQLTYISTKYSERMWNALRNHIMHERKRKKQQKEEEDEEERLLREIRAREQQNVMSLEETKEQITQFEHKLSELKEEKHQLFLELKKVLNEDDNRRKQLLRENNELMTQSMPQNAMMSQFYMPSQRPHYQHQQQIQHSQNQTQTQTLNQNQNQNHQHLHPHHQQHYMHQHNQLQQQAQMPQMLQSVRSPQQSMPTLQQTGRPVVSSCPGTPSLINSAHNYKSILAKRGHSISPPLQSVPSHGSVNVSVAGPAASGSMSMHHPTVNYTYKTQVAGPRPNLAYKDDRRGQEQIGRSVLWNKGALLQQSPHYYIQPMQSMASLYQDGGVYYSNQSQQLPHPPPQMQSQLHLQSQLQQLPTQSHHDSKGPSQGHQPPTSSQLMESYIMRTSIASAHHLSHSPRPSVPQGSNSSYHHVNSNRNPNYNSPSQVQMISTPTSSAMGSVNQSRPHLYQPHHKY